MTQNRQQAGRVGAAISTRRDLSGYSFGNRGSQLAESIMGFTGAVAQTAEVEGERAYREGLRARLDDVERDNANDANQGLFAPLFRQRALDGFDYQDAQFDAANVALEEQIDMYEALKNSTRLEDFQAWAANRDAGFREGLEGRSDVYRAALAEKMASHRESQARTFGSWVIQNRERQAREAAAAAAKARAQAQAQATIAAGQEAFAGLFEGSVTDVNEGMQEFLSDFESAYGLPASVGQELYVESLVQYADIMTDPRVLDGLDPRILTPEQRNTWMRTQGQIESRTKARTEFDLWTRNTAESERTRVFKQERDQVIAQVMPDVLAGRVSPSQLGEQLFELDYYQENPDELLSTLQNLTGTHQATVDPIMERAALNDTQEDIIGAALRGENVMDLVTSSLDMIRSPAARQQLIDMAQGAEKLVQDRVWDTEVIAARQRDFQTLFANTGEQGTILSQLSLADPTPAWVGYVTDAMQDYKSEMIDTWADWYRTNPEGRMDRATKKALERQVFDEVRGRYEAIATSTTEEALLKGRESNVDALNELLR